jgi:hypothetical protein
MTWQGWFRFPDDDHLAVGVDDGRALIPEPSRISAAV